MSLLDVPRASLVLNARTTVRQTVPGHIMSNAEFSALSLHTKDWEHFPNANTSMQVSGPRCGTKLTKAKMQAELEQAEEHRPSASHVECATHSCVLTELLCCFNEKIHVRYAAPGMYDYVRRPATYSTVRARACMPVLV